MISNDLTHSAPLRRTWHGVYESSHLSQPPQIVSIRESGIPLCRDTHGAILILGIVLGVALTTGLFYLIDIGEGILWRESAQNAADSGAFENAVWHARGMNMIAALNLLLSLLSAVIVMWRLTVLALGLATLTDLVSSMTEPGTGSRSTHLPLSSLVEMLSSDDSVAKSVSSIAAGLSAAQVAVATYTPMLATQIQSPELNMRGDAVAVATFSGSLFPDDSSRAPSNDRSRNDFAATHDAENPRMASSPVVSKRLGTPFSLPVETDSHSLLCPRLPDGFSKSSTKLVQRLPGEWRNRLLSGAGSREEKALEQLGLEANGSSVLSLMKSLYGLTTTAPALFCARPSPPLEQLKQILWKIAERTNDESAASDASISASIQAHLRDRTTPLTSVQEAKALFGRWQSTIDLDASAFRFGKPAKMWVQAQNGNVYLRSAAVVSGKAPTPGATPFHAANTARPGSLRVWAHAEAYFDCTKNWNECSPNAMWQLRWRARLRRIQPYADLLRHASANPARVDPSNLEATIASWLERSARQVGHSLRPSGLRGFVPEFDIAKVRETPTFRLLDTSRGGATAHTNMAEFLQHQSVANSVVH